MEKTYRSKHGMHAFTRRGKKDIHFTDGVLTTSDADVQNHVDGSLSFKRGVVVEVIPPAKAEIPKGIIGRAADALRRKFK